MTIPLKKVTKNDDFESNTAQFSQEELDIFSAFAQNQLAFNRTYRTELSTLHEAYKKDLLEKGVPELTVGIKNFYKLMETVIQNQPLTKKKSKTCVLCYGVKLKNAVMTREKITELYQNFDPTYFQMKND